MKRILAIAILIYLAFLAEFVLYNAFGSWGKLELMLLGVIFCNLYWGIRYSIWSAFCAGVLKDAFSISPFGTHILVYITAAYLTTWVRSNFYQPGSRFSRMMAVFFVLAGVFVLETLMRMRLSEVRVSEAFVFIFLPQAVMTMLVATFMFHGLRAAVVKLKL